MMATSNSGAAVVTLPSDTQILITREFDAARHLVYKAWTTPELIRRWWSGDRGEVTIAEVDLRVGGAWRYVMIANGGFEVAFHGEFREVVPDERIASTEIFETIKRPTGQPITLPGCGQSDSSRKNINVSPRRRSMKRSSFMRLEHIRKEKTKSSCR